MKLTYLQYLSPFSAFSRGLLNCGEYRQYVRNRFYLSDTIILTRKIVIRRVFREKEAVVSLKPFPVALTKRSILRGDDIPGFSTSAWSQAEAWRPYRISPTPLSHSLL